MSYSAVLLSDCDEAGALVAANVLGLIPPDSSSSERGSYDVLSESVVGIASVSGWGVIFCDSGVFLGLEDALGKLSEASKGRRLFFWLTQSASGGLWFEAHEDGELKRKWLEVEGEVEENEGTPLPQEPEGFFNSDEDEEGERDEDALFELSDAVTGVSTEEVFACSFAIYPSAL
jgi:hypothetical protein